MKSLVLSRVRFGHGFSLVEVTLALGIAVFCLVVIFGLLNVGINTSSASVEQTVATDILSAVAGDLRAAPTPSGGTGGTSVIYGIPLPLNVTAGAITGPKTSYLDPSGQPLAGLTGARYELDVWTKQGAGRDATQVRVVVSWPPKAVVQSGSVETMVALDRN